MKKTLKRNALLVCALALYFWWAFLFLKHDPVLRTIIPFGEDPYDAVSSYGVITAGLLAFISVIRALFGHLAGRRVRLIYILRTQAAVPLCVLVSLSAEGVSMARHIHLWLDHPGRVRLVVIQASLLGSSLITLGLIACKRKIQVPGRFGRAGVIWITMLLTLALYPEELIVSTAGHLLTIVLGCVFLFAPLSALTMAWLPDRFRLVHFIRPRPSGFSRYASLIVVGLIGFIVGGAAYVGELNEGEIRPALSQILFVGGIYAGLGTAGLLIGYAWLGKLLGLGFSSPK